MEFGVCFKGELSPKRLRSLVRQLEAVVLIIVGFMIHISCGATAMWPWRCVWNTPVEFVLDRV